MTEIYLLVEDEPDADEFPSIVVAAYTDRTIAEAALVRRREQNAIDYPEKVDDEDIFLSIEPVYLHEVLADE